MGIAIIHLSILMLIPFVNPKTTVSSIDSIESTEEKSRSQNELFSIQEIDSVTYFAFKEKANMQAALEKLTDLVEAKERLKGRVIWGEYDYEIRKIKEAEEGELVYKVFFDNGKTILYDQPEAFFVDYYPEKDILSLEGGHSSSLIFNLTTGEETEEVGDPAYWCDSPSGRYRFNGYYTGNADVYFIQKKSGTKYKTIIELDYSSGSTLARSFGFVPEYLFGIFWHNDSTMNFMVSRYYYPEDITKKFSYQLILE